MKTFLSLQHSVVPLLYLIPDLLDGAVDTSLSVQACGLEVVRVRLNGCNALSDKLGNLALFRICNGLQC